MPSTTTAEEKARLRSEVKRRLAARTAERRAECEHALFARFLALEELDGAQDVLLYVGVGDELDTRRLFPVLSTRGKRVWLPRCLPERGMEFRLWRAERPLELGAYAIPEPSADAPLWCGKGQTLAVVPGLAFDGRGRRLGRGGGYYDRFLAEFRGLTVALCPGEQLVEGVPVQGHDAAVDVLVCEDAVYRLSRR